MGSISTFTKLFDRSIDYVTVAMWCWENPDRSDRIPDNQKVGCMSRDQCRVRFAGMADCCVPQNCKVYQHSLAHSPVLPCFLIGMAALAKAISKCFVELYKKELTLYPRHSNSGNFNFSFGRAFLMSILLCSRQTEKIRFIQRQL